MIYMASAFFTPSQIDTVSKVESMLDENELDYYSPRKDGVLNDMSPEERQASLKRIFELNVANMNKASIMLANIDGEPCIRNFDQKPTVDRDMGVAWELGYFYGRCNTYLNNDEIPIITYSANGHGSNVMISQSTLLHVPNLKMLSRLLVDLAHTNLNYIIQNKHEYTQDMETTE